jgi:hypothetical protein
MRKTMLNGYNKKGMYFATMSILLVFVLIIGYGILNEKNEIKIGANNFGKASSALIKSNLEVEKLKFFIKENVKISKEIALSNLKLNGGRYGCETIENYAVLDDCKGSAGDSFYLYFNDSFDSILKKYKASYGSEDFEIVFEDKLFVKGTKRIPIALTGFKKGSSLLDTSLDHDNILEYVEKYSQVYSVPEDLLKAIIMQESQGVIDAENSNADSTDHGVMQINDKAHPEYFDGSVCDADGSVECNIMAGADILRSSYDRYKEGREHCNGKFYTGWEAALRGYNGWGCMNLDYVEKVIAKTSGEDVFIEDFGYIEVDFDITEEVDFGMLDEVILASQRIKDCDKDYVVCGRNEEGNLGYDYIFNILESEELLIFNVEENKENGETIKFAWNI